MSETAEQGKDRRLEEARRILESPNRAYELLNLIGVRDELLEACNDVIQHWGAGLKHLEVGEKQSPAREDVRSGE